MFKLCKMLTIFYIQEKSSFNALFWQFTTTPSISKASAPHTELNSCYKCPLNKSCHQWDRNTSSLGTGIKQSPKRRIMKQPRTSKERNLGWELFEELSWERFLPENISDMVYTIKHLLPAWPRIYMYSCLVSVLADELWPSASKVIAILEVMWPFDWHLCIVTVCVGVWQHNQL